MVKRRSLMLLGVTAILVMSSMLCDVLDTRESDALLEAQNMTSIAAEATRFSLNLTETAQASITPSATASPAPTNTPVPATQTPDDPPDAIFAASDASGDTFLCDSGEAVGDPAVDILSVMVFDPAAVGSDHEEWLVSVELGVPANETFANDWSGSVVAAFAPQGASAYSITVNEVHAGETTTGRLDESSQGIQPGTEDHSYVDERGNVWFLMPRDTTFMRFASFHTPTEDLPPEEKRCDLAPDEAEYTFNLP